MGARGTHIILDKGILPPGKGIMIPETSDGRLIFVLPYINGYTLVGTTDNKCIQSEKCKPEQADVDFLVNELKQIFGDEADIKSMVKSQWAGIRPLVKSEISSAEKEKEAEVKTKDTFLHSKLKWIQYKLGNKNIHDDC